MIKIVEGRLIRSEGTPRVPAVVERNIKGAVMKNKNNMLTALDLFCGTKSITKAFRKNGIHTLSLDFDKRFNPDIYVDILNFDYKLFKKFNVIWASPPCTCFSIAGISHHWKRDKGLKPTSESAKISLNILKKTIEIIEYFNPKYWFIENPVGLMRKMDCMDWKPHQTITYCQYGDNRMKPTDIWGIFPKDFSIRRCKNGDTCHVSAPRGSRTGTQGLKNAIERSRIPDGFCELLAEKIKKEGFIYD